MKPRYLALDLRVQECGGPMMQWHGFGMLESQKAELGNRSVVGFTSTAFQRVLAASLVVIAASLALSAQTNSVNPSNTVEYVVQSMEKAQSGMRLPNRVTSEYHLGSPSSVAEDSKVVAQIDFGPPGKYAVQRHWGSMRAEYVVRNVVQREVEITSSAEKLRSTALNRRNYDFEYLGKSELNGHDCYLLQIIPKRKVPELIQGRAWVDGQSFLVRKIEGDLVKSPSWWVKSVHVKLEFSDFYGMWLQTSMDAVADVRCFGTQELTSQVLDYTPQNVAAKKPGKRWITPLSASVAGH